MLKRKMFRDMKKNLSQFLTIFLMIMIGVMAYSGIEAYMEGMKKTADVFYRKNNLQDLNVMGFLSKDDIKKIEEMKEVKSAEGKLSVTATTNKDKILLLNFIESNEISKFYVMAGEGFQKEKEGIWLDNFYAEENNIQPGDQILVKYDTLSLQEEVLGLINVPDHLYDVRDESELYPDRKEFGFAYMSYDSLPEDYLKQKVMTEFGIKNEEILKIAIPDFQAENYRIYNSIMVDVKEKKATNIVKNSIEDTIPNAKAIIKAEDTSSYITYQGEIDEGKTYVGIFSGIFLFIALLSVITTMTRVVQKERIQIGTLKALGFSNHKILFHYIGYGFWIAIAGSIIGLILGYFLIGKIFIDLEMSFFEIPNGKPSMNYSSYLVAILVVLTVSFITYLTGKSILKDNPVETLRTKIPDIKGSTIDITKAKIFQKMRFENIWNIRDILRNKMRTIMGLAGVIGCCMLIVCALGMLDSMNFFVKLQFETLYHFDYKLNIKENTKEEALQELYKKYGKKTSSSLGIEIKDQNGNRESNNIFVTNAKDYIRFVDRKNKIIKQPEDNGVYITYKLAKTKGYQKGDKITWHIYGDDTYYESKIIGFNKDPQNQNITMSKNYLESLNIKYQPDSIYTNKNFSNVKEIANIETIQDIDSLKEGMEGMLSMMKTMIILIIFIAILLGEVIIYNLGILSFSEKEYQFATLKVLGFTNNQIENIFIKQNNWIAIISIIIGCPLGFYLTDWLFKTAIEEHYDFGASITTRTYILSALGTLIISYLVSKFLSRRIKKIDMVTSLKGNE